MIYTLRGAQEVLALGTLIPNETGEPVLHLHAAAGREGQATVGCTRAGVRGMAGGGGGAPGDPGNCRGAEKGSADRVSVAAGLKLRRPAGSYPDSKQRRCQGSLGPAFPQGGQGRPRLRRKGRAGGTE